MPAKKRTRSNLAARTRKIRLVLFDVDGVLTDGGIYYSANGLEMKRFNAQDGYGIRRAKDAGLLVGIISGRTAPAVETRAKELQLDEIHQGVDDKSAAMDEILHRRNLTREQVAFMGDDLFDLPLLDRVGLSAAPANARPEVKKHAVLVTPSAGGNGAARDLIDFLLAHR